MGNSVVLELRRVETSLCARISVGLVTIRARMDDGTVGYHDVPHIVG